MELSIIKELTNFMLLNGYASNKPGLMYGKTGIALSLFELASLSKDSSIEEYALDFLREALATDMKDYSFVSGKSGIAWTLLFLINNHLIAANYQELYGIEHQSIINFIKGDNINKQNISDCIDFLIFLFEIKKQREQKNIEDIDVSIDILLKVIADYYSHSPKSFIEREYFYLCSSKLLGIYNLIKCSRLKLEKIVKSIIITHSSLVDNFYHCPNLKFGTNLFLYGIENTRDDIVALGNNTLDNIIINIREELIDLKQSIDILFCMKLLSQWKNDVYYCKIIELLTDMLFLNKNRINKMSPLYDTDIQILSSLLGGIPRLAWLYSVECTERWSSDRKLIMLF